MVPPLVHALQNHVAFKVVKAQIVLVRVQKPAPKHLVPVLVRQMRVAKRARTPRAVVVYAPKPFQPMVPERALQKRVAFPLKRHRRPFAPAQFVKRVRLPNRKPQPVKVGVRPKRTLPKVVRLPPMRIRRAV